MSNTHTSSSAKKKPASFIKAHKYEISDMPEPGVRWIATDGDVRDADEDKYDTRYTDIRTQRWLPMHCIKVVDRVGLKSTTDPYHVYETVACNYYRAVKWTRREDGPIPGCDHSGIHNSRDLAEDVVTCSHNKCDNTAHVEDVR